MFKFSQDLIYSMPAHFGGAKGPRTRWNYSDVTSILVSYETDLETLAHYVPEGFEITRPVVSVQYAMNKGVEWMAGGSYNLIAVNVPVSYAHAHERIDGWYALVIWENKTCPILGGREETGMPKIFANIEDHHQLGDRLFTNASYEGSAFLRLSFRKTRPMTADELSVANQRQGKLNWFGWRYIPNVGRAGAALSHATLYPVEFVFTAAWIGEGSIQWQAPTQEQHPLQAHIIDALSRLPIKAYRDCSMSTGSEILRTDIARQLP